MKELIFYPIRHLYRVTIEMVSPLKIGTGEHDLETDAPVAIDVNGLPYIPSTSLCGVFRHYLEASHLPKNDIDRIFGNKDSGSRIIFSEGKIVGEDGSPIDGIDIARTENISKVIEIPIRQHVRLTEKGVADESAKFDEEVLLKGTRFCIEIETLSSKETDFAISNNFVNSILLAISSGRIYLGGGTRRGFGKVKAIDIKHRKLVFSDSDNKDFKLYLDKSSNLRDSLLWKDSEGNSAWQAFNDNFILKDNLMVYELELKPKDFFIFGSGKENSFGDLGMTQIKESIVSWKEEKPKLIQKILIPASSVKGAISHRVAFRYNQRIKNTVSVNNSNTQNKAVMYLFGTNKDKLMRGNVLFEDIYLDDFNKNYTLSHNKIDRLTGGTIGTALFHESPAFVETTIKMRILVDEKTMKEQITKDFPNVQQAEELENDILKSFEATLKDITNGILPLGGGTNRGNGIFYGSLIINGNKQ